jgi:hypothetical protein
MTTTTLTLAVVHGELPPGDRTVPDAMPAILRELADQLDGSAASGTRLAVPRDRGRLRLRYGAPWLADITGVRAAWTAVTK